MSKKPILCLDFDGVIHSYTSGWKGAAVIPDPPVPGTFDFIRRAQEHWTIAIFSSRSLQEGGLEAMKDYVALNSEIGFRDPIVGLEWPLEKPPAMLTIDDRALTFTGNWADYDPADLLTFQPWNKRPKLGATGEYPEGVSARPGDEGALAIAISKMDGQGNIHVDFGKPVAWVAMPATHAIQLAKTLLRNAGAKKIEIEL